MNINIEQDIEIFLLLSDDEGHANWEIANRLKKEKGNINKKLKKWVQDKVIFTGDNRDTRNPQSSRPKQQERPYYLVRSTENLDRMMILFEEMDNKELMERILNSKFTSNLLKEVGFPVIFSIVEKLLKNTDTNKIISRALLNLPSAIEEYNRIAILIHKYLTNKDTNIDHEIIEKSNRLCPLWSAIADGRDDVIHLHKDDNLSNIYYRIRTISSKHIRMLERFDPLEAVSFYRKIILPYVLDIYWELVEKSIISESLFYYIYQDIYLSPFSSFPMNDFESLLYSRPFHRIYDDVYLLSREDLFDLKYRSILVYENFADFLFEFFKNYPPISKQILEMQTKELLFHWNVASTNFDSIWHYLESIYGQDIGSGKYHLKSDGIEFQIIDLETNKRLDEEDAIAVQFSAIPIEIVRPWGIPSGEGGAYHMAEPFTRLRPCYCCSPSPKSIEFEDIFENLKSKFKKYALDYDSTRMS